MLFLYYCYYTSFCFTLATEWMQDFSFTLVSYKLVAGNSHAYSLLEVSPCVKQKRAELIKCHL